MPIKLIMSFSILYKFNFLFYTYIKQMGQQFLFVYLFCLCLAFPDDDEVLPADERLKNWRRDFSTARLFIVCVSRMPQMPSTHKPSLWDNAWSQGRLDERRSRQITNQHCKRSTTAGEQPCESQSLDLSRLTNDTDWCWIIHVFNVQKPQKPVLEMLVFSGPCPSPLGGH